MDEAILFVQVQILSPQPEKASDFQRNQMLFYVRPQAGFAESAGTTPPAPRRLPAPWQSGQTQKGPAPLSRRRALAFIE